MFEQYNQVKSCINCGTEIDTKAEICTICGVGQPLAGSQSGKKRLKAALLALFLGGLVLINCILGKLNGVSIITFLLNSNTCHYSVRRVYNTTFNG